MNAVKFSKKASAAAKYLCFDIAESLLNAIFDCNFANLKENRHPSLGFRVLIVAAMVLLLGCSSNQPRYKEEWLHNQLRYQQSVESVSKRIESFHKEVTSIDSVPHKALLYKVCTAKVDGEDLWFPCDLDSARLASVLENLNTRDSLKAMESRVVHISYAAYVMRYGKNPVYSPLYQNDDGSYEALCASADGVNCNFLYANLVISKKMVPGRKDWSKRKFYRSIGKNLDEKNDLSLLLDSVYTGIVGPRDKPWLIPFEMCYKDGFAEPCQKDSAVVDSVRKVIESRRDTLVALSYQAGSLAFK